MDEHKCHFMNISDDVLLEICDAVKADGTPDRKGRPTVDMDSIKALSQCNRKLRATLVPTIFRSIKIDRVGTETNAVSTFNAMEQSENVAEYTENFVLDIGTLRQYEEQDSKHYRTPEDSFLQTLMTQLARILGGMKRLQKASLMMTDPYTTHLQAAFEKTNTQLPTLRILKLAPYTDFLLAHCPNLIAASHIDWRWIHGTREGDTRHQHSLNLISAASHAPKLQHLALMFWWRLDMLEAVYSALPNIPSLAMIGGQYHDKLPNLLPLLAKFQHLKVLTTANVAEIGIRGYNPPRCGNAYMGPGGKKLREQVQGQMERAQVKAAVMVFEACKGLEVLWLGDATRCTVVRGKEGSVEDVNFKERRARRLEVGSDGVLVQ